MRNAVNDYKKMATQTEGIAVTEIVEEGQVDTVNETKKKKESTEKKSRRPPGIKLAAFACGYPANVTLTKFTQTIHGYSRTTQPVGQFGLLFMPS